MKISVSKDIFDKFPDFKTYIVHVKGANIETKSSSDITEMLREAEKGLKERFATIDQAMEQPSYRAAYDAYSEVLGDKVSLEKGRFLPSHIALSKRVIEGGKIPNINPFVNFYNALSIKYGITSGAEDLSSYYGDLTLRYASEGEKFLEVNSDKLSAALDREVVWSDDHSITCRMWGWRQSERSKVTAQSKEVILILDLFNGDADSIQQLVGEVARCADKFFDATTSVYEIGLESPIVEIDFTSKSVDSNVDVEKELQLLADSNKKGTKGIRGRKPVSLGVVEDDSISSQFESIFIKSLEDAAFYEGEEVNIREVPTQEDGDLSTTLAFALSKKLRKAPVEAATDIIEYLKGTDLGDIVESIDIAGNGFINFTLDSDWLIEQMVEAVVNEDYGKIDFGDGKKILIESPSLNPNKTPHVGHMLNLLLGGSLSRLFKQVGYGVANDNIANDKGLPVMQTIWAYVNHGEGKTPYDVGVKPDHFVNEYYVQGKRAYSSDEQVKEEVQEILRKWESEDPETRTIWKQIVKWADEGQLMTVHSLNEEIGHVWNESEVYESGRDIVQDNLGKGVIEKLEDGALIARIEKEYGLKDTILLRSDGTGLYHTQDIGLTIKKREKFDAWRMVWVVAEEQIDHFQRLFAVLDAIGIMPIDDLYHFAYAFVVDKDGKKLSSRNGEDITADGLLADMTAKARTILEERLKEDMEESEIEHISKSVAIGAFKYTLLSRDPFKNITFDMEESLSFSGKSGPYIMYANTRAFKILEAEGGLGADQKGLKLSEGQSLGTDEKRLLKMLLKYPSVVAASANSYSPSMVAEYLYDLAKAFNNFYENVSVKNALDCEREVLLALVKLFFNVSGSGLSLLGIGRLERM